MMKLITNQGVDTQLNQTEDDLNTTEDSAKVGSTLTANEPNKS